MRAVVFMRMALNSLQRSAARSSMAALGVVVGVGSVVAMMGIGEGARARVEQLSLQDSWNQILVDSYLPRDGGGLAAEMPAGEGLQVTDYLAVRSSIPNLLIASPQVFVGSAIAETGGRQLQVVATGLDVEGFELFDRVFTQGRPFATREVDERRNVAVVSQFVQSTLFDGAAVGGLVRINDVPFRVIGVVADDVSRLSASQQSRGDVEIFMPFSSLQTRVDELASMTLLLKARGPSYWDRISREVGALLESRRGKRKSVFTVHTSAGQIAFYFESSRTLTRLLLAIAAISLLVGGVGIMNIMFATVTERTREVGIRMAMGTRAGHVLAQFLVEAIALCAVGGTLGVAIGTGVAWVLAHLNGWPFVLSSASITAALVCSSAVGIFFGYYPALRAARLNPVEALRSE